MAFKQFSALNNPNLAGIDGKINLQQQLLKAVKAALPEALAEQIVYCLDSKDKVVIYTQSANWASQLRFYATVILEAAQVKGLQITQVQFRLTKIPSQQLARPSSAIIPSLQQVEEIKLCGNAIQDKQLRQSLLKLSQTLRQLSRY